MFWPELPRNSSLHHNKAVGCMLYLIGLGFVIHALIGVFGGYLILPEISKGGGVSGEYIEVRGVGARIAGVGLLVMLFIVILMSSMGSLQTKKGLKVYFLLMSLCGMLFIIGLKYDQWFLGEMQTEASP